MELGEIIKAIGIEPYYRDTTADIAIYCADCRSILPLIPDKSIDLVLTDPPYGITACAWDSPIPFGELWHNLLSVARDTTPIIFTTSQPFTSALVMSNPDLFRHEWIYKKRCASNFAQAKYSPMKEHESVLVFGKGKVNYYPIKEKRVGSGSERVKHKFSEATRHKSGEFVGVMQGEFDEMADELRYPSSVQEFNNRARGDRGLHPTQKPYELFKYFMETYSIVGNLVLDPFLGSGTTTYCAKKLNRKCIGIEIEEKYCEIAARRCSQGVFNFRNGCSN